MDEEREQGQGQGQNLGQRVGSEIKDRASQKVKEKAKNKLMSKLSKEAGKKAAKASMKGPMMVVMLKVLIVVLIIIAIIGIIMFLVSMPGMIMDKLKQIAKTIGNSIASWFGADQSRLAVEDEQIYETLGYLEQMGYDLAGEGLLTKIFTEENPTEWFDWDRQQNYEEIVEDRIDYATEAIEEMEEFVGKESLIDFIEALDNKSNKDNDVFLADYSKNLEAAKAIVNNLKVPEDISEEGKEKLIDILSEMDLDVEELAEGKIENGVIRSKDDGSIIKAESVFLYNYFISDNYVYTVKNFNPVTEGSDGYKWWSAFAALGVRFLNLFGNIGSQIWGEGLIALYHEGSDIGMRGEFYDNDIFGWDSIKVDAEARTLTIRKGWGENKMVYSLDGWTGRYGMPLEFLLSVHLSTKMPDLAYDMTKLFAAEGEEDGTEIEILLHDLDAKAIAAYKKDFQGLETQEEDYILYSEMDELASEGWSPTDGWTLSKEEAFNIMKLGIYSPEKGCTFTAPSFVLEYATDNGDNGGSDTNYYYWDIPMNYEEYANALIQKYAMETDLPELNSLNDELGGEHINSEDEEFSIGEAMLGFKDENMEYTSSAENYAKSLGYDSTNAEKSETTGEIEGNAGINIGTCTCEGDTPPEYYYIEEGEEYHVDIYTEGFYICPDHSDDYYYIMRYCPPSAFYKIERTVTNRYWTSPYQLEFEEGGETKSITEDADYTWVTYRYRVYSYSNEGRTENKTYIGSYFIDYIIRNKIQKELIDAGILNEDGTPVDNKTCGNAAEQAAKDGSTSEITECCENCRKHVKKIRSKLGDWNDENFETYEPYISKVKNHWFRDVYFAISKTAADNKGFIQIDPEYEALMNERWTLYETNEDGTYKLYEIDEEGNLGKLFKGTQAEANEKGIAVAKKADTIKITDTDKDGDKLISWEEGNYSWSAYKQVDGTNTTNWERLYKDSTDEIEKKLYVNITAKNGLEQVEEGQRAETNNKIKKLFLNNRYFKYDGSQDTAKIIEKLRDKLPGAKEDKLVLGALEEKESILNTSVQYDVNNNGTYDDNETFTVEEYSGKVELTQNSLSAFSMLENTHTLDADFIYKDFKELVVELGYFTKEELTDETPKIFQWLIPEIGSYGYPIASLDKNENEFGTMLHSKEDYEANVKNTLAAKYAEKQGETNEEEIQNGAVDIPNSESDVDINPGTNPNVRQEVNGLNVSSKVNIEEIIGAMGSDIERRKEEGDGYEYKVNVNGVEYTHYYQAEGSYKDNQFIVKEDGPPNDTIASEGCGPTSCCNILTGYGVDVTPADTAAFLKRLNYNSDLVKVMENWGVSSQYIEGKTAEEYKALMEEAISEGKPIITLMVARGDDAFWFAAHFVAIVGVDNNGNMITVDCGTSAADHHTYTPGIEGAAKYVEGILIPDEAPTGSKSGGVYEGFEGGEAVVSPVTGILLEYGTYDETIDPITGKPSRVNVDFKPKPIENSEGESDSEEETDSVATQNDVIDKVGYAKILVLDDETYLEIENKFRYSGANALSAMEGKSLINDSGEYLENKELKQENILDNWSEDAITLYGYKEFAELYSDFGVSGNIIYIDGFKCELPAEKTDEDEAEESEEDKDLGNGTKLSLEYFKNNSKEINNLYEKEDRYNLSSKDTTNKLNNENDMKDLAAPVILLGDKVVIKEGTVIGRTMSNKELVESRGQTYVEPAEKESDTDSAGEGSEEGQENTSDVQGNYLRIIMKMIENKMVEGEGKQIDVETVVENVEEYLKLDEEGSKTSGSDWELFFWLPFECGAIDTPGNGVDCQGTCSTGETAVGIIQWTVLARDYIDDDKDPLTPTDQDNESKIDMNNIAGQFIPGCLKYNSSLCAPLTAYQSWSANQFWEDWLGAQQFRETLKQIAESDRDAFLETQMEVAKQQYLEPLISIYPWLASRPACVQGAVMHLKVWGAETAWLKNYVSSSDKDIVLKVRNIIANTSSTAGEATGNENVGRAYNEPQIALEILDGNVSAEELETWIRNSDSSVFDFIFK